MKSEELNVTVIRVQPPELIQLTIIFFFMGGGESNLGNTKLKVLVKFSWGGGVVLTNLRPILPKS